METKFNFKSQICTDRIQSERLLALGIKKETADMCWMYGEVLSVNPPDLTVDIPAWSLHRLLCMYQHEGDEDVYIRLQLVLSYDDIIDRIEYDIKEGYFNKEYLE